MHVYTVNDDTLERLTEAFEKNFTHHHEIGASLSLYQHGKELLNLAHGHVDKRNTKPWTQDTLIPIFSATKAASATCVLMALYSAGLTPEIPVRKLWPRFPLPHATISELLSHQCGLAMLDEEVPITDHESIISAIERQSPAWTPPTHGYHPRMFGPLTEELIRRLTGTTLGQYWDEKIRAPLDIDFWIGLPEGQFPRVATLSPGKANAGELSAPFYKAYMTEGTPTRRAFTSPLGYLCVQEMNTPAAWTGAFPALGGIATASALAAFYQACLGYTIKDKPSPIPAELHAYMSARKSNGIDRTILVPTAFSTGFMVDPIDSNGHKTRSLFGPHNSGFGHPGAGGSIGLADPVTGISLAYTMNQMELGVLPGKKAQNLLQALFTLPPEHFCS